MQICTRKNKTESYIDEELDRSYSNDKTESDIDNDEKSVKSILVIKKASEHMD